MPSFAQDLPKCDIKGFYGVITPQEKDYTRGIKGLEKQSRNLVSVDEVTYTNGFMTAKVNEALVKAEFRPIVLVPKIDFAYKANFLATRKNYTAGSAQFSALRYTNPSGEKFDVLSYKDGTQVFVREDGTPCNKVASFAEGDPPISVIVMHTYRTEPQGGRFERNISDSNVETIGIRIIYLGLDKGAMKFQETRVENGVILGSKTHEFDQFAKLITISDIPIQIKSATAEQITAHVELNAEINNKVIQ